MRQRFFGFAAMVGVDRPGRARYRRIPIGQPRLPDLFFLQPPKRGNAARPMPNGVSAGEGLRLVLLIPRVVALLIGALVVRVLVSGEGTVQVGGLCRARSKPSVEPRRVATRRSDRGR